MDKIISITPTITTDPYTAGDSVGGLLSPKALDLGGVAGALHSITVIDQAAQDAVLDFLFFKDEPTVATITDNAPFAWGAGGDEPLCIGRVRVTAADYVAYDSKSVAHVRGIGSVLSTIRPDGRLYIAAITFTTPTYAVGDLTFHFGILKQ